MILAFDIGIKNLAFCVLDPATKSVYAINNCSLLPPITKTTCSRCQAAAAVYSLTGTQAQQQTYFCRRHLPTGKVLIERKHQTLKPLREAARSIGLRPANKISDLIVQLAPTHLFEYTQPRQISANTMSLVSLHDAIRQFIDIYWDKFKNCSAVLLENQPVLKNAHMKSVQILLFATLRERFLQVGAQAPPSFHLVHAKKKSEEAEAPAGDEGYKQRKSASEARTRAAFETGGYGPDNIYKQWASATRRADMADAFCMCIDYKV
jgi:hypothetical protein